MTDDFFSLDAVLDHYSGQVQPTPNLDPLFRKEAQLGIALAANDKLKILAFLKTLNDRSFVLDKRFSEPF